MENESKPKREKESNPASFSKSLFGGRIFEDMVFPYPRLSPEEEETLNMILDSLRKFAADHIDSVEIDEKGEMPQKVLDGLKELGIFGMQVPEEHGGFGLSQMAYGRVFEELGAIDASVATTVGAHASIGMKALLLFGTKDQKERFLPKLVSGETLAAFALTEPGSGSDAYSIKTRAEKKPDGSYVLNGNKIWITNGSIADFFTIFAKTQVEIKGEKKDRVTAFIVTRDMEGFSTGKKENKMGIRGSSTTEIALSNVCVPAENILGELGRGFKIAMEVLNSGRLGLGAGCLGGAKQALGLASRFACERKQFGQPIAEFGLIQEKLAQMAIDTFVTESLVYLTCGMVDAGVADFSLESAITKIDGSETVWSVSHEALQIAGGTGYMREYPYERLLRDARINTIFEGTNQILSCFIALSGMKEVGEVLRLVGKALNDPIKSMGVLYDYFVTQKIQRSLYGDRITKAHPELKREAAMIEEHVAEFAGAVEKALRRYRKKILLEQFVQQRLTQIAMDLYRMVAVVSRVSDTLTRLGLKKGDAELTMARAFCVTATRRISKNFRAMDRNLDDYFRSISKHVTQAHGYATSMYP